MRRLLEAMDSMSRAEKKPTGPKFPGYWKGTDPASAAKNKMVGGCEQESVIPELAKTAKKKSTEWELEEAFKQFKEGEFRRDVIPQQQAPVNTKLDPGYGKPLDRLPDPQGDQSGGFKKVLPGEKFDKDQWSLPGKPSGTPNLPVSPDVNTPLYTPPYAGDPGLGVKVPTDRFDVIGDGPTYAQGIRPPYQARYKPGKEPVELKTTEPPVSVAGPEQEKFDVKTNSIKVNPATGNVTKQDKPEFAGPTDTFIKDKNGKWVENPKYSKPNTDISPEENAEIDQQIKQQQQVQQPPEVKPAPEVKSVSTTGSDTLRTNINKASSGSDNSAVKTGTSSPTQTEPEPRPGSWQELAKLNNITDPTKLRAGQTIRLPDDSNYTISPNDTLSGIAHSLRTTGQPPGQLKSQKTTQADRDQTPPSDGTAKSVTTTPVYVGGKAKRKAATITTPEINYSRDPDVMSDPTAPETKGYQRSPEQKAADAAALAAAERAERARQKLRSNLPQSKNKPKPQIAVPESFSQRLAKDFEQFLESDEPYSGYDQDVKKLKQRAKLGPMKTVWDEKTQRYRVVPVKPQEKQIKEYGNAQDANQQATNANQQQTSQTGDQKAIDQQVDIATAKSTMSGLKNVLGPQLNTNAAASGVVKMNDGKPLSVPEREAISTLTPLVSKAAENPATASALKSALSTAGMLAKQGK